MNKAPTFSDPSSGMFRVSPQKENQYPEDTETPTLNKVGGRFDYH